MNIAINKNASLGKAGAMARRLGGALRNVGGSMRMVFPGRAAANHKQDRDRHAAAQLARTLIPIYIEHNRKEWAIMAAIVTAEDYATGLLDATIDPHALAHCHRLAIDARNRATDETSKRICTIAAHCCRPVVNLKRVRRMVGVVV